MQFYDKNGLTEGNCVQLKMFCKKLTTTYPNATDVWTEFVILRSSQV